jgi:hypothetical protein
MGINNLGGTSKASKTGLTNQQNNFMLEGINGGVSGAHVVNTAGSG